jgi:hypothetical protein
MIASLSKGGPQPHTGWLGAIHVGGACGYSSAQVRRWCCAVAQRIQKKNSVTSETSLFRALQDGVAGVIRAHDIPVRQHEAQQRASFGSGIERKRHDRHGSTCQLIGKP